MNLTIDGESIAVSDGSWKCSVEDSYIVYNQLRTGEYFDARKFNAGWMKNGFDDSKWHFAVLDETPPTGKLRKCTCQPIRETERLEPIGIYKNERGYVVDFGKNISGYCETHIKQKAGDMIVLEYAEDIDENKKIRHNLFSWYPEIEFQVDKLICSGGEDHYKPYFTYHGFRYLQVDGLTEQPTKNTFSAVFVHQDVKRKADFRCSDDILNYIYDAGIRSTYSNMFYSLTDCPTREKLGWTNDAQSSAEQTILNFDIVDIYKKWIEDLKVSVDENRGMPGVCPSPDWGFGNGPVCDCLLFELPYQIYKYIGDKDVLIKSLPAFYCYLRYLDKMIAQGHEFPLADWTGTDNYPNVPKSFIVEFYQIKAYRITVLSESLLGNVKSAKRLDCLEKAFIEKYNDMDGNALIEEQTTLSMQICYGLYKDFSKIKGQLLSLIERTDKTMRCGMLGTQYLFDALTICGAAETAMEIIITSNPGYRTWYENGATTLWEMWNGKEIGSHNHHMFSNVLAWFIKSLLGFRIDESISERNVVHLQPVFVRQLSFCEGYVLTVCGKLSIGWKRESNKILYTLFVPEGLKVDYNGKVLLTGKNVIEIIT